MALLALLVYLCVWVLGWGGGSAALAAAVTPPPLPGTGGGSMGLQRRWAWEAEPAPACPAALAPAMLAYREPVGCRTCLVFPAAHAQETLCNHSISVDGVPCRHPGLSKLRSAESPGWLLVDGFLF